MQLYKHSHLRKGEWILNAKATPILVIGDSNIARITKVNNPDVSLESYPGAKFYNITQMLDRAYDQFIDVSGIQQVVFSVGINNRDIKPATAIDNFRRLRKAANRLFPAAEIWFCEINYSAKLKTLEKDTLDRINQAIRNSNTTNHIRRLPAQIQVVRDNIHWTEECANQLLAHWLSIIKSEN